MSDIFSAIEKNIAVISIIVIFLLTILILLTIIYIVKTSKLKNRFDIFMKPNQESFEELMRNNLIKVKELEELYNISLDRNKDIELKLKSSIKKVSIQRYKAFADIGSDLSFSLALLDSTDSGVILTGIYGRDERTVYAKPIDQGISRYPLSEEENKVLKDASAKFK